MLSNIKKLIAVLIIVQIGHKSIAQVGVINNQVQANSYVGAEVYQIPVRPPSLKGTPYLNDNWLVGNVYLKKGGVIKNDPVKYDILNQQVLIRETKRVMLVKLNYADSFNILQPNGDYLNFIVNRTWTNDGKDASGVYERLTTIGNYGLLKKHEVILIKANYNVALSAGEKDDRFEKKFKLYFVNSATGEIEIVPKGKKKMEIYFNNEKISLYLKSNKPDIKKEAGLIDLILFSNSIQLP